LSLVEVKIVEAEEDGNRKNDHTAPLQHPLSLHASIQPRPDVTVLTNRLGVRLLLRETRHKIQSESKLSRNTALERSVLLD
jgi:hypothetical protein